MLGVDDPILGQAVIAWVVLLQGRLLREQEVLLHCNRTLEPFMVPKYLEFRDNLPRTS
ncbi:AMP-binding enzyme [Desulfonatronum thioautotrophicum]|uniref:AMP-binding enzyme n=1 Tax=Desulfonatronum thioautotrophicum TaxID=617001 RepID=UPI000A02FD00|nr:hypothetical protein [Desulfonatronum thioautotrophicum]